MGTGALEGAGWRRAGRRVLVAVVCLVLAAAIPVRRASGQELTGAGLRGQVRGQDGRTVPGAAVRLLCLETGKAYFAQTDGGGRYGFLSVPPGAYRASVRLPWAPVWTGSLGLELRAGAMEDRELALAEDGTGVQLVARDGTGDGTAALPGEASGEVQADTLNQLPVPERRWEAVEAISSGARDPTLADSGAAQDAVTGAENHSEREAAETASAASGLRLDGIAADTVALRIDGVSAEQAFRGGPRGAAAGGGRAGSSFAQGAVGRLWVSSRGAGESAGGPGMVQVSSRGATPGEGRWHGSGFLRTRQGVWGAVNPFAVVTRYRAGAATAQLLRSGEGVWDAGGSAGRGVRLPGLPPAWRAGLFGSAEMERRERIEFASPQTAGFYALSGTQRALLANRGVSTRQTEAALGYLDSLTGSGLLQGLRWLGFGRLDVQPRAGDRLSVSYQALRSDQPALGGAEVAEGVLNRALSGVGSSTLQVDAAAGSWTHVLGPRWTVEMRGQLARDVEAETPGAGTDTIPAIGPGGFAPQVTIGPEGFRYGTPANLGRLAYPDERRVETALVSVWRFGAHVVTVGGDWSRVDDRVFGASNLEGSFLYDSGTTRGHAGGLVDWITDYTFNVHAYPNGGCPSVLVATHYFCFRSYAQSFANLQAEFVTHDVAGFAQDAVQLGRTVRLSVGARWQYQLLPFPLAPNTGLDAAMAAGGMAGDPRFGTTASLPEDRNNVGPRAALRWAPGGRDRGRAIFVLDAGYGMQFGQMPGATLLHALTDTGAVRAVTSIRITPTVETNCPQVANQGFGFVCSFPYAPVGVAPVAQTASAMVFSKRFRLPVVQRASLGVERGLGNRVVLRARYATAWATQLPETTDLNIAASTEMVSYLVQGGDGWPGLRTGQSFQVPLYTQRRSAKFGPVTAIVSNANATYHSGTAELEMRAWHGWGLRAEATISKAIDYGPLVGATPRQDGQFDPFADGYDKGRSSLDRPWQTAGTVVYRSRWERGGEWGRALLGGWQVAAIGRAGSGAPYSYVISGGERLAGGHESVNGSGGATYLPTVGRNTLRLPMRSKLDLQVGKEMRLPRVKRDGGPRLTVQADAFNLLNTVSYARVESRAFLVGEAGSVGGMTPLVFQDAAAVSAEGIATPAFGTPLSSTTGLSQERTVEAGVRVSF